MRTTLAIDDALLARAKKRAAQQGITLGRFVDEALRTRLASPERVAVPVRLPVFPGGRPRPGIDARSNRALLDALDEEPGAE
ncbi:MAG: CopG family transcriptional regulator [Microbacteriaceae bacterium]